MLLTDTQAKMKMCPHIMVGALQFTRLAAIAFGNAPVQEAEDLMPQDIFCRGAECAMWRYRRAPVLRQTFALSYAEVESIFGIPDPIDFQDDEWTEYGKKVQALKVTKDHFKRADGWELDDPKFDDEGLKWYAIGARVLDPCATGFCGLAGEPSC